MRKRKAKLVNIDGHMVELLAGMTKHKCNGFGDRDEIELTHYPLFSIVTDVEAEPVKGAVYTGPFFVLDTSGWTELQKECATLAEAYAYVQKNEVKHAAKIAKLEAKAKAESSLT